MPTEVTLDTLRVFLDAFNRHDLDAIMCWSEPDFMDTQIRRWSGPGGRAT
jgi:hypothetical protein